MQKLVKNSLGFDSNLFVYQDKTMFNYSVDTILLGNFVTINAKTKQLLEIGTNNGALAIFISARYKKLMIDALEIQAEALVIAQKNLLLNNKTDQINLIFDDFNIYYQKISKTSFKYDAIVCNPPFYKLNASKKHQGSEKLLIATHEIKLTLEQIIFGSSQIIKQRGYLSLVLPTERLIDATTLMRKFDFEVKRIQFIHPRVTKKSNLVLVEGRFKVGWGTHFLVNIYLHPEDIKDHSYQETVKKLYKPIIFDKHFKINNLKVTHIKNKNTKK